jgi:HSP20 family protein
MAMVKWLPTERNLMTEMDRMLENMRRLLGEPTKGARWAPEVNIFEKNDEIVLEADVPGVDKSHVHVEVNDSTLTLRGERSIDQGVKDEEFYRFERPTGAFSRVFTLPASVDVKKIDASLKDGVLIVKLPKTTEAKAKQIAIH